MPPALHASLAIGLGLVAAYGAIQLVLQVTHPVLANDLLRLFFLTMVAGREPALFAVYQTSHPVPVPWAAAMAITDDIATLFLAAPLTWLIVDRLRRRSAFDALLRSFERSLSGHRAAIHRWGVVALALFLWLPGWGTGPSMSVAMGILAGIPPGRLLPVLAVSDAAVSLFWAVTLAGAAEATPDNGLWDFLPLLVIGLLVVAGLVAAWRQRHHRFLFDYPVHALPLAQPERLAAWGFEERAGALQLDARRLEAAGGPSTRHLSQCHWAGELLLLPSMTPPWAGRLAALGVTGIRDLALLPGPLLREAMGLDMASVVPVEAWVTEARAFMPALTGGPNAPARRREW